MSQPLLLRTLTSDDTEPLRRMLAMFGEAFNDQGTYSGRQPDDAYLRQLLARDSFIALAAFCGESVIGGIASYVLHKFEQPRAELYLYDLAVHAGYRRRGVATAMIEELKNVAARRGIYVIFVQADYGDEAAIALYTRLGVREDVLHFDIPLTHRAP